VAPEINVLIQSFIQNPGHSSPTISGNNWQPLGSGLAADGQRGGSFWQPIGSGLATLGQQAVGRGTAYCNLCHPQTGGIDFSNRPSRFGGCGCRQLTYAAPTPIFRNGGFVGGNAALPFFMGAARAADR
jgi:hypothetical protein